MIVKEILKDTENKMKKTVEAAKREFSEVRTGRAHPGLIEGLHIDYFGTLTLLKQLASISVPDPRTIIIQPWDANAIAEIEKAINKANMGVTCSDDGKIVRVNVPPLSEERRQELKKVVKDMAEKSKISLRTIRRDANEKLKKMQTNKEASEDDIFKAHEEVQKLVDKYIKDIDELLESKINSLLEFK